MLFFLSACGESQNPTPLAKEPFVPPACALDPEPPCMNEDGILYCPDTTGYPFLGAITSHDERSTAIVSVPEPGTLCLRGTLAPRQQAEEPHAELVLGVSPRGRGGTCILSPFDAQKLGITSLAFTLDQIPATRVLVTAAVIQKTDCLDPFDCVAGGVYTLFTPDREDLVLGKPGVNLAPFEDFVGNELDVPLDSSRLSLFTVRLVPIDRPLEFGFCVSEVGFLDAAGHPVVPPGR